MMYQWPRIKLLRYGISLKLQKYAKYIMLQFSLLLVLTYIMILGQYMWGHNNSTDHTHNTHIYMNPTCMMCHVWALLLTGNTKYACICVDSHICRRICMWMYVCTYASVCHRMNSTWLIQEISLVLVVFSGKTLHYLIPMMSLVMLLMTSSVLSKAI